MDQKTLERYKSDGLLGGVFVTQDEGLWLMQAEIKSNPPRREWLEPSRIENHIRTFKTLSAIDKFIKSVGIFDYRVCHRDPKKVTD